MYLEDLPHLPINKVLGSIWPDRKVGKVSFYTSSTIEFRICKVKSRLSVRMRASGIPLKWVYLVFWTDYVRQKHTLACPNCLSGTQNLYWFSPKQIYVCKHCCEIPSIRSVMKSKLSAEVRRQLRIGDYGNVATLLQDPENLLPVRLAMEREGLVPLIYTARLHRRYDKRLIGESLYLKRPSRYGRLIYADGKLYARS